MSEILSLEEFIDEGLLEYQADFISSEATHTGLVVGYGGGKSLTATRKTLDQKTCYPGVDVSYYLPTYSLIEDIAFLNFEKELQARRIPYNLNKKSYTFFTPFGKIICRSMNNPEMIIGYEVGYSCIDECDVVPKDKMKIAFKNIVARNRVPLPDGAINKIDMVSTPEGFEFMWEFFVKNKKPSRHLIQASSRMNPFLPETYFDTLLDIYTEEQVEAYIGGQFVNLSQGLVFSKYSREFNRSSEIAGPGDVLHIGIDFNITNMSCVFHKIKGEEIHAIDEITGAYDTPELIELIKEKYPRNVIIAYPDESGNNRNTAGDSDVDLLRKAKFKLKLKGSNPRVKDRVSVANGAFCNAKGDRRYYINDTMCSDYAEALERLPYKKGVPDKTSGFDHITEAGTYPLYKIIKVRNRARISAG